MKIAILAYAALQFGNYYYITHLARELDRMGVDVEVIRATFPIKFFGTYLYYLKYGSMNISIRKFDVVQSSEGAGIVVMHKNMVETYHHDYVAQGGVKSHLVNLVEDVTCRKAKRIIVPSYATLNCLLRYGYPENKIRVVHHGVDHEVFKPDRDQRERIISKYKISGFTIITVGQLIKRKRHIDIIKALSSTNKNLTFILVGHGPEEKRILSMANKHEINVLLFRHVPRDTLVGLYNAADIYVHTSVLEGFGMTILEAMSCGLPIIAYETADFQRMINNAGFVLKQGDVCGLTEKIELLRQDEKMWRHLSQEALKQSKKFTWKESALEHLKVYREILEDDKPPN